ncbi:MAG: hypothetical protein LBQ12_16015, partial [Deltaproteobacteria bacterium]|nr:hypothetical protein [Deltaproteobacteria bacterium]
MPPFQEILVPALAAISMNKTTALDTLGRIVQRFTLPGSSLSLTGPVPAPDPGQDPYSSDKKGGDSLGIRGRLFWAVFFLEREGFVRASAPGSYSATVKGRRALPLMLSGLGKGTLKRYPALRRLVPSPLDKGEGGAGKAGPGNGGIDLSGLRPWEGAVPPTDPELALSCLKASLALAGHAAKDGRDLKALSLRHLSEDRARAGEPPADPRDPQLPKRLRAAAQSLKACGLLARASRGDAQGM